MRSNLHHRGGFSFVEVLFAVMILGIGFIMVAAMFPAALTQTQNNTEETAAATIARGAVEVLEKLPDTRIDFPPDGKLRPFTGALYNKIRGNLILPEDPRYGWVPFFRRGLDEGGKPASTAQVVIIAMQCRNHGAYTAADLTNGTFAPKGPYSVTFTASGSVTTPDTVTINAPAGVIAPNTYLVIGDEPQGKANGWVFRVGINANPTSPGTTWELAAGNDMKGMSYRPSSANVYVVGVGIDPATNAYSGQAQDISAYTTFIPLN